jgi:hypothetical protein
MRETRAARRNADDARNGLAAMSAVVDKATAIRPATI